MFSEDGAMLKSPLLMGTLHALRIVPIQGRRQISVFCTEERPYRLPILINTTSKTNDLCQMVLHPPVELARIFGKFPIRLENWSSYRKSRSRARLTKLLGTVAGSVTAIDQPLPECGLPQNPHHGPLHEVCGSGADYRGCTHSGEQQDIVHSHRVMRNLKVNARLPNDAFNPKVMH
jgi:hypothetical protein